MALPLVSALVMVVLVLGYRFYGRLRRAAVRARPCRPTPASGSTTASTSCRPSRSTCSASTSRAIAAAGPIAGPILACQQFGWLPAILWIALGVVFIGAVHDFSTLIASRAPRGHARSPRWSAANLGPARRRRDDGVHLDRAHLRDRRLRRRHRLDLRRRRRGARGARASPSTPAARSRPRRCSTCSLAVVMGVVDRLCKPPLWLQTVIFVPPTLGAVWVGHPALDLARAATRATWAVAHPRLLLRRLAHAGVGAAPAARLPRRLRPLPRRSRSA